MGLFDFFRPQKTPVENGADALTQILFPNGIFPGGREEIMFKAGAVQKMTNGRLDRDEAIQAYTQASFRFRGAAYFFDGVKKFGVTAEDLVERTMKDWNGRVGYLEATRVAYYVVFDRIDESLDTFSTLKAHLEGLFGRDDIGCSSDEIPTGLGEFGLDPTNPVPVRGIQGNTIYLDWLRTADGREVEHKRLGSLKVPNVFGHVDEYEIAQNGRPLCKLYVCPYNQKISARPPTGFLLLQTDR